MSKHTPGPWFNTSQDDSLLGEVMDQPVDSSVTMDISIFGPNAKADARLIAAAPDMLEALKDAVAAMGGMRSYAGPESVRNAIAKATGEAA